jgi:hypothetical protein
MTAARTRRSQHFPPRDSVPLVATSKAKTHSRGYGRTHQQIRKHFERVASAGAAAVLSSPFFLSRSGADPPLGFRELNAYAKERRGRND